MAKCFEIATKKELAGLCVEIDKALQKGRIVKCEVKSISSKTMPQLGYYWNVILPRTQAKFREEGNIYSLSQINDFFNDLFFFKEIIVNGRIIKKTRSKSGASKDEMSSFIDSVIRWCAEWGIYIPEPEIR